MATQYRDADNGQSPSRTGRGKAVTETWPHGQDEPSLLLCSSSVEQAAYLL